MRRMNVVEKRILQKEENIIAKESEKRKIDCRILQIRHMWKGKKVIIEKVNH